MGSEMCIRDRYEIISKVKNYYYIDHGYFNQSKREFKDNRTGILNLDGYFRIVYNNFVHNGQGNFPEDRFTAFPFFTFLAISNEPLITSLMCIKSLI